MSRFRFQFVVMIFAAVVAPESVRAGEPKAAPIPIAALDRSGGQGRGAFAGDRVAADRARVHAGLCRGGKPGRAVRGRGAGESASPLSFAHAPGAGAVDGSGTQWEFGGGASGCDLLAG